MTSVLGVRGRLFLTSVALILLGLGVSTLVLERQLETALLRQIEADLADHLELLRQVLPPVDAGDVPPGYRAELRELAQATGARVTLVDRDDQVLADSALDPAQLPDLEDHGDRPEIRAAREGRRGRDRRRSETLGTEMLYVALPDRAHGRVLRIALPLDAVGEAVHDLRTLAGGAALIGLLVAAFMSWLASHLAARKLEDLVRGARAVAAREEGARLEGIETGELGVLADSFNRLGSELDRVVETLGDERDRIAAVLEGMDEAVVALDADWRVTLVNRAASELLALPDEPTGRPILELVTAPPLAEILEQGPPGSAEVELPGVPPRRVAATLTSEGASGGSILVLRDVTRLRRLESIRRDFVANVSHELRTPLSVIRANAETLLDGAMDDPRRGPAFLRALHENAERLASLIADLLDISRIESGKYPLERARVDVAAMVQQVFDMVGAETERRRVDLARDVPSDLAAQADENALLQVFRNLVENAVRYVDEGGQVEVRAREQGGAVRVEIRDDGPGISPEHRERIFERFYRVDEGRHRYRGGTGLGLAIVKHLVTGMGGRLGVEGREPRGTVFWFELPRAPEEPPGPPPA